MRSLKKKHTKKNIEKFKKKHRERVTMTSTAMEVKQRKCSNRRLHYQTEDHRAIKHEAKSDPQLHKAVDLSFASLMTSLDNMK